MINLRKEKVMKKVFIVVLCVLALSISLSSAVFAAGGQEHADKAQGEAYQNFETPNPPFDP